MKSFRNLISVGIAILTLSSCGNDTEITSYRGKVKFETISVSSKLAGRISKIYVEEGQTAKKGDTLALLYLPEVNAKMTQVEGAVTAAKGQLNMALNGATIEQYFPVTASNAFFIYNYAAVLQNGGHASNEQPFFKVELFDSPYQEQYRHCQHQSKNQVKSHLGHHEIDKILELPHGAAETAPIPVTGPQSLITE